MLLSLAPFAGQAVTPPRVKAPVATARSLAAESPTTETLFRDPFLPLDYQSKSASLTHTEASAVKEQKRTENPPMDPQALVHAMIHVQGFLHKGDRQYALINGRMAGKGDVIQVQSGGATYRFLVKDVTDRNVAIEPLP